jgi:NAD(P)-dependent dehydrogenase (short-subunit alcohol dehydrogenase family)
MATDWFVSGDIVVVTGAAQGFGRAIAVRLASMGARLALWDIARDLLTQTADRCRAGGATAVYEDTVDLGNQSEVQKASERVRDKLGVPFGLINNGAVYPRTPFLDLRTDDWERVLAVNLTGQFTSARCCAAMMAVAGRGNIVNVSSTAAFRGDPNGAHYAASKAGLVALSKSMALALAPKQIRVNCIVPGTADTAQPLGAMTYGELIESGREIPLGRIGRPEDIAGVVAFLLGPDAAYITGQSLAVNGGAYMVP